MTERFIYNKHRVRATEVINMGKRKVTWTAAGWYRTKKDAQRTADGVRARGYYARTTQRAGGGYDVKRSVYTISYYKK